MAQTTITQTVLNQVPLGPSSVLNAAGGSINLLANTDVAWCDLLTVSIMIHGKSGSPTGGQLAAKWRLGERFAAVADAQYTSRIFTDLTPEQARGEDSLTVGGDWPDILADYTIASGSPVLVQRSIRPLGSLATVILDASSLTGGTNPTFTISAAVTMKG
ncbi:hypothetical protein SEA_KIKO_32 [Gordonia phage Kiko]|nr:hypothetical protein SEA_KIKO_32 [Gordonia phage Kiko]